MGNHKADHCWTEIFMSALNQLLQINIFHLKSQRLTCCWCSPGQVQGQLKRLNHVAPLYNSFPIFNLGSYLKIYGTTLAWNVLLTNKGRESDRFHGFSEQVSVYQHFPISGFIIRLAPRAGKMNRISRCNWLPERARWSYLARSGYGLCPARNIYHVMVLYPV